MITILEAQRNYDYNQISPGYYDRVFLRKRGIQSKWHHMKFKRIAKEVIPFERLLDIGCGPGTFIGNLQESGTAIGIDIAEEQIYYAKKRYGQRHRFFRHMEAENLLFRSDSFDVVTLIEVVEHLPVEQCTQLLQEAIRVLKPGGRILVSTPNYASFWPIIEYLINKVGEVTYAEQHIIHFDKLRLDFLLRSFGFSNISVTAYLGLAPFLAFIDWRVPDLFSHLEPEALVSRYGFLLLGKGTKKE